MDNNTEIQNAEAQYPKNAEVKEKTKEVKKQKRKVTRRNVIILILIIIILLLLTFRSCSKEIDVFLKGLNGNPVEMDLNKESIEIPVITTFNVDGRKTDVTLTNPVENEGKFCLQYDLYITDNEKETAVRGSVIKKYDKGVYIYGFTDACLGFVYVKIVKVNLELAAGVQKVLPAILKRIRHLFQKLYKNAYNKAIKL